MNEKYISLWTVLLFSLAADSLPANTARATEANPGGPHGVPAATGLPEAGAKRTVAAAGLSVLAMPPLDDGPDVRRRGPFDSVGVGQGLDLPHLENNAIVEASGLDQSHSGDDLFWINNDSGDLPRIYAVNGNGAHLGVLHLSGASHVDYEDIACGAGPEPGRNYIYIADVGDNGSRRSDARIYRVEEPLLSEVSIPFDLTTASVDTFPVSYPDGPHNCETLLLDPETREIYLVIKRGNDVPTLYRGTTSGRPGVPQTLENLGEMPYFATPTPEDPAERMYDPAGILAGDLSTDGREIIIRTHRREFYWHRQPGESISDAMRLRPPRVFRGGSREPMGESICFAADGSGYYTLSEEIGTYNARLHFCPRLGDIPAGQWVHPSPAGRQP